MMLKGKLVLIRFSSFGDILQAYAAAQALRAEHPDLELHWVTRSDFSSLLANQSAIHGLHVLDRKTGIQGLWNLAQRIAALEPQYIYDAHNNVRSRLLLIFIRLWVLSATIRPNQSVRQPHTVRRSKDRIKRFLYLGLRLKSMQPEPIGVKTYLKPLVDNGWLDRFSLQNRSRAFGLNYLNSRVALDGQSKPLASSRESFKKWLLKKPSSDPVIGIVPSAAWANKRWPLAHFQALVESLARAVPQTRFVLFGGPGDDFAKALVESTRLSPDRIYNGIGQWSLVESSEVVQHMHLMIGNDTGLMHMAERLNVPALFLVGPTAFGYPIENTSRALEVNPSDLSCKPCSKDGSRACTNRVHMKCMLDLSPEHVLQAALELLHSPSALLRAQRTSNLSSSGEIESRNHSKKEL